jgi:hypothetical protein
MSGRKLSAAEVAELRELALYLIEHPEDLSDPTGLADLLGMAVAFADILLAEPAKLPEGFQHPENRNGVLAEMCRLWIEEGKPIEPALLPWLAIGFREMHAALAAAYQDESVANQEFGDLLNTEEVRAMAEARAHRVPQKRRNVEAAGRMMTLLVQGFGRGPTEASEIVSRATGIEPGSAIRKYREYRRYRKEGK